jgi:branched-chain amino acid transport system substrate-binding protein
MTRGTFPKIACGVALAAALGACGSSSKQTTGPPATQPVAATQVAATSTSAAATHTVPTATATPFVVGTICSCTGPQAAAFANNGKVVQAWASALNAAGGLNGHPVKVIVKDDGGDPARSLQAVKELVAGHVVAIVGDTSTADQTWASYIAAKGIPVVGGLSAEAPFLSNPDFFPSGTQILVTTVSQGALAQGARKAHFGIAYCAESPVCAQIDPLGKAAAALYGLKYSSEKISATAPNYTAPCLAFKQQGVDALYVVDNAVVVTRFIDACAQQGFKPTVVSESAALSAGSIKDPAQTGTLATAQNANPYDTSLPATAAFQGALNKYVPGFVGSPAFSFAPMFPWSGAQLFEAAAKSGHLTPSSTPAEVKQALYGLKNETLGGLAPPLSFTRGKPAFVACYFTQKVQGGRLTSTNGNKPVCLGAAQLKALAKLG